MRKNVFTQLCVLMTMLFALSMGLTSCNPNDEGTTHEAVDLGLSVKWATCNIGASAPEQSGDYYAWGELSEKDLYTQETYKFYKDGKYENIGENISGTEYDVVRKKWGDGWRMPTMEEFEELLNNCTWEWTSINGVNGYKVSGNGNSIFLPTTGWSEASDKEPNAPWAGFYWSGTMEEYSRTYKQSNILYFDMAKRHCEIMYRDYGFSVRPVIE